MRKHLLTVLLLSLYHISYSQNVGIGTATPNASSKLEITATDRGLLIPRIALTMTTSNSPVTAPATSLLVYNTATVNDVTPGFYYWNGSQWLRFSTGQNNDWTLLGNAATVDGINFIGTTDNVPFNIRVNNQRSGRIDQINANTYFGYLSGTLTGTNSTGFGTFALTSNTTGTNNTAVGSATMFSNTTGNNNTAVGQNALRSNVGGNNNTAVGYTTLQANTSGIENTAIGYEAMRFNTTGQQNSAMGFRAMRANTTGAYNNAFGNFALNSNTSGIHNTAMGYGALNSTSTGNYNVGIGNYTLNNNSIGTQNVALGYYTLYNNTANNNNAIGAYSLQTNTTGSSNTAIGDNSGNGNTTGSNNVFIGNTTGNTNTTGSSNTFIGSNTNPSANNLTNATAIGANTSVNQSNALILGSGANVGIGTSTPANKLDISAAARSGTHATGVPLYVTGTLAPGSAGANGVEFRHNNGTQGIGFGYNTIYAAGSNPTQDLGLSSKSTGNLNFTTNATQRMTVLGSNGNVGIATNTPTEKLTVSGNLFLTGFGRNEIYGTDRNHMIVIRGDQAGTAGDMTTYYEYGGTLAAGLGHKFYTGGVVASQTLKAQISDNGVYFSGNVGLGTLAPVEKLHVMATRTLIQNGSDAIHSSYNTASGFRFELIGSYPGFDARGIYLGGYNINVPNVTGYSAASRVYCGGAFGSLPITATAFTTASSQRYKQNIVPVTYGLSAIMQLRPVQYQYIFEALQQTHVGLIAEEVNNVIPEIVVKQNEKGEETTDIKGKTMGINYSELTPVFIKAIQEQQAQIELLKTELDSLKEELKTLKK